MTALGLAIFAAFKKFVLLRKEDDEYEKALDFRKNLKKRISELEKETGSDDNSSSREKVSDVLKAEIATGSNNSSSSSTKVVPFNATS